MTKDEFKKFMTITTEEAAEVYSKKYLAGEYTFETTMHEITFSYNLALFFSEIQSAQNQLEYVFRSNEKYYYPVYYYLKAIRLYEDNKDEISHYPEFIWETIRRCYVNLGSELSNQFRTISAIPHYRAALTIDPRFDMAIGNFAMCIEHHSPLVGYNSNDKVFNMLLELYSQIDIEALDNGHEFFLHKQTGYRLQQMRYISEIAQGNNPQYEPYAYFEEIGESDTYENWCILNILYLNYVNDLGDFKEAMFDIDINILSTDLNLSVVCAKLLQNMIDSYIYNRKKLFENQNINDRNCRIELINIFNAFYSFFDLGAYFLYKFYGLSFNRDKDVSIYSIWNKIDSNGDKLLDYKNQYLYNIYWLKKEYRDSTNSEFNVNELFSPDAQEFAELRNIFDHRGSFSFDDENEELKKIDPLNLYRKTTKLAKIARELILSIIQMVRIERKLIDENTGSRNLDLVYFEFDGFVPSI